MLRIFAGRRGALSYVFALAAVLAATGPGWAQIQAVDPDAVISRDLGRAVPPAPAPQQPPAAVSNPQAAEPGFALSPAPATSNADHAPDNPSTYRKEELVAATEGAFGKGARDVAVAIGDVLKKQGEPNGYIVGSEGGGAFIFGLRYGSGRLHQKGREARPVYWSGPSLGFDAGAAGGDTFMLVYNLDDPEALFSRFGAGEGQAYVVGGMHVGYLRKQNVVLIPVRMGVGVRLGVNAGYMKFSRRQNIVPF
jgi:hypothetical protein